MDQNNHNIKETHFNGKSYLVYMDLIMLINPKNAYKMSN